MKSPEAGLLHIKNRMCGVKMLINVNFANILSEHTTLLLLTLILCRYYANIAHYSN